LIKKLAWVLLAFGISLLVALAPRKTTSSTITYEKQSTIEYFLEPDYEASERLYQEWLRKNKQKGSFDPCSCVSYARWKTGINVGSIIKAKNHPVNSDVPIVGGYVIIYESYAGHIAVITEIFNDTIIVEEYNYSPCNYSTREIRKNSSLIKGYYY